MLQDNGPLPCEPQLRADASHEAGPNLLGAALRLTRRALRLWREAAFDEALESLIAARQAICKLIERLPADDLPATQEAESRYISLLSMLIEAQQSCDTYRLEEAIRLLEEQPSGGQESSADSPAMPIPPPAVVFAAGASNRSPFSMEA